MTSNPITAFYIDYGCQNLEPVKELRALKDDLAKIPAQAIHVHWSQGFKKQVHEDLELMIQVVSKVSGNKIYRYQIN